MPEPYVLISRENIESRIATVGNQIREHFEDRQQQLHRVIIVLKGADHFAQHLMEFLNYNLKVSYVVAKSYHADSHTRATSTEVSEFEMIAGENILVVEDIVDTGHTLNAVLGRIQRREPGILKSVSLLDKPSRREVAINPDWSCFKIPNLFVYGYGLDLAEEYRGLPYVMAFKRLEKDVK